MACEREMGVTISAIPWQTERWASIVGMSLAIERVVNKLASPHGYRIKFGHYTDKRAAKPRLLDPIDEAKRDDEIDEQRRRENRDRARQRTNEQALRTTNAGTRTTNGGAHGRERERDD